MPDLVGVAEIAARLEVGKSAVSTWKARGLFPRPLVELASGPIWQWRDVYGWAARTGRLPAVRCAEVTAEDMAAAERLLPHARRTVVAELVDALEQVRPLLAEPLQRPPARRAQRDRTGAYANLDGAGNWWGEWDWYYALPARERERLSRRWLTPAASACSPDQLAEIMGRGDDIEGAMTEWVRATALADAVASVRAGRFPSVDVAELALTTYEVSEVYGPEPLEYLARMLADERERYGAAAERAAEIPTDDETSYALEEVF